MFKNVLLGSGDSMNVKLMNFMVFTRRNPEFYLNPSSNPTESTIIWGRTEYFCDFRKFCSLAIQNFSRYHFKFKNDNSIELFLSILIFRNFDFWKFRVGKFWDLKLELLEHTWDTATSTSRTASSKHFQYVLFMFAMSPGIISIERTKNHGHTRRTDETATDLLNIAKKAHLRHELNLSSLNAILTPLPG